MPSEDHAPLNGRRFYRDARNRPVVYAYSIFMTALVASTLAGYAEGHDSSIVLVAVLSAIWVAFISWFVWFAAVRIGLVESESGLSAQALRRKTVAWSDIASFEVPKHQPFGWTAVYARLHSGRRVNLAVSQGRRVVWHGGDTEDITSVLRARLSERHDLARDRELTETSQGAARSSRPS
jgi:hypothetical protein